MKFEPDQLRFFSALMNEGTVSCASAELRTTPGNVRRVWHELEQQLGEPLFVASAPGVAEPTPAARRLEREMNRLLGEIRRFEGEVRKIHQTGRVLRLGADRHLFNTSHFGRLFNTLRCDRRFRISFVDVAPPEGRAALEAGACDLLFTETTPEGRRFEARELPPLPLDVACAGPAPEGPAVTPETLATFDWALAAFSSQELAERTLDRIQRGGGGRGCLWRRQEFLRWAEVPEHATTRAVVCIRPVAFDRLPNVSFLPLQLDAACPLQVAWLKQHPYEFISTIVDQMDQALADSPNGSRSPQS